MKEEGFVVSVGPHIQSEESVSKVTYGFIIALLPALVAGVYFFKMQAVQVILVSLVAAVVIDAVLQKVFYKKVSFNNYAIFAGLLFAAILPVSVPWWAIVIGMFVGLLIGQYVYGGLGSNPFNPVLVGWAALKLSYPGYMDFTGSILGVVKLEGISSLVEDYSYFGENYKIENWSSLGAKIKLLMKTLLGWKPVPGYEQIVCCIGGIMAIAIIIGGIFLLWKRYISWHAPAGFLLTVLIFSILFYKGDKSYLYPYVLIQLFSGSTLLATFFLVTDPVTTPFTGLGMFVFGILAGLVTMIGRLWSRTWVEPVWFAVLLGNAFTPLIDRLVKPKPFGRVKSSA